MLYKLKTITLLKQKILISVISILSSCQFSKYQELSDTLELSSTNKTELLKVLDHYEKMDDSLKYKAAVFLIKHMKHHFTYSGEGLETYDLFFDTIKPLWKIETLSPRDKRIQTRKIADSLNVRSVAQTLELIPDPQFIKSSYLIENIDLAFKAWEGYPWSRTHVSFEDFCKYILPYKVYNEPIQSWRDTIMKRYHWLLDSIEDPNSLREATIRINKSIREDMVQSYPMRDLPMAVSFQNLEKGKIGKCEHMVTLNIYLLRAMGIPARVDYVPLWGNGNIGHTWASIQDEGGKLFAFDAIYYPKDTADPSYSGVFNTIPESLLRNRRAPKVVRNTYESHYENLLPTEATKSGIYPEHFLNVTRQDVTTHYNTISASFQIDLPDQVDDEIIYLSVYNSNKWQIAAHGIRNSNGLYECNNIGCGIVYLPVLNTQFGVEAISNPFLLTDSDKVEFLNPDHGRKKEIRVDRKYYVDYNVKAALKKMVNGVFQGANYGDFRDAKELYIVDSPPLPRTNNFSINDQRQYRYLRFVLPEDLCRVAEMRFFGFPNYKVSGQANQEIELEGKFISSHFRTNNEPKKVNDGNVLSYFVSKDQTGGWVGIDLGENSGAKVSKIEFYPPNDGNSIEIGDHYELFYWENGWQSLGDQVAQEEELMFTDCPGNALFILRNHTKGKAERIFTYENGKQVWW